MPYYSITWCNSIVKAFIAAHARASAICMKEFWIFIPDLAKLLQRDPAGWNQFKNLVKMVEPMAKIKFPEGNDEIRSYTDVRWFQEFVIIIFTKGPTSAFTEILAGSTILKRGLALPDRAELVGQLFLELE